MKQNSRTGSDIPRYAVLGHPVAHSQSPRIHRSFVAQFDLNLEYTAIEVEPEGFPEAVTAFQAAGGLGLNVTVPFKQEAWRLADSLSERARLAGAVNTLRFESGGERFGDNTDGAGLARDLERNLGFRIDGRRILVVGAGGAVRGVLGPLLEAGPASLVIANRTAEKALELADRFAGYGKIAGCGLNGLVGESFDLVINGTAASLAGKVPELPSRLFRPEALAYDMMYGDRPTVFMDWAQEHGAACIADGLGMLVEQAAESFYLWRGLRPNTAPALAALRGGKV
ncbi:MAG: shikimate dehydrogenase [Pseudomonadota bacterium]|nr:shikimate dehydrogenase [Pseudomonadota bacterium]